MKLWSGPSVALQHHTDAWEERHRHHDAIMSGTVHRNAVPGPLKDWALFARSYHTLGDGETAAGRENLRIDPLDRSNLERAFVMYSVEYDMLNRAVTHYVSHDMVDLITAVAEHAEPELLFPTDLPCDAGLAIFEYPLIMADLNPKTGMLDPSIKIPVRAMGWVKGKVGERRTGNAVDGVTLIAYTDSESFNDVYIPSLPPDLVTQKSPGTGLRFIEFHPWAFGSSWSDAGPDATQHDIEQGVLIATVAFERRWFLAFMRLMWQEILSPEFVAPNRGLRRRVERINWKDREQGDIKVLRLRRVYSDDHHPDDEPRNWTLNHRTITRGHWRRQYYRSLGDVGDPAAYRLIWIAPYIRGPEDRPLIIKNNITTLVR